MAGVVQRIDGKLLRQIIYLQTSWLAEQREAVNALNVFPVPDGDTGTNMHLTMMACLRQVDQVQGDDLKAVADAAAAGSLMGARGNSGVILSQFFRGFARYVAALPKGTRSLDGPGLARALEAATETAYKAVMKPVEGTMLTVGRGAATEAQRLLRSRKDPGAVEVASAAVAGARRALEETPKLLPVLAEAGVVDAGGKGLLVLLEAALAVVAGQAGPSVAAPSPAARLQPAAGAALEAMEAFALPGHEPVGIREQEVGFRYCTEFLVRGEGISLEAIREGIAGLGDCILVVGDEKLVKVHLHTDRPGQALEVGSDQGELLNISINNMQEQNRQAAAANRKAQGSALAQPAAGAGPLAAGRSTHHGPEPTLAEPVAAPGHGGTPETSRHPHAPQSPGAAHHRSSPSVNHSRPAFRPQANPALGGTGFTAGGAAIGRPAGSTAEASPRVEGVGVVAVVSGRGLEEIFRSLGAAQLVSGGQTMNPSTEELVRAVEAHPASEVLLLPNNGNVVLTAQQVPSLTGKRVRVVPTRSVPEGLSAMLALNPLRSLEANAQAMEEAARAVRTGEVTFAVRSSRSGNLAIREGDVLGIEGSQIAVVGRDRLEVAAELCRRMLAQSGEILSIYYGEGVTAQEAQALKDRIAQSHPGVEVEVHAGGQPLYYFLLAVE